MSLNLDARQRAMLQEMGITLWLPTSTEAVPAPVAAAAVETPTPAPSPAAPDTVPVQAPPQVPDAAPVHAPSQTPAPAPVQAQAPTSNAPAARAKAAPAAEPATPAPAQPTAAEQAAAWSMAPLVQLYAPAGAQQSGGDGTVASGDAWLVLIESPCPMTPLAGDAGRLLDNMLRALRLHHHPQVWLAGLQRPGSQALPVAGSMEPVDWQPLPATLDAAMARIQPARVLVLGQAVARAVLQRTQPLGQLRAQVHSLQGTPAVVTYDPAYLLRSAHAKPGAWADLCLAAEQSKASAT